MLTKDSNYVKFSIKNLREFAKTRHMVITFLAEEKRFTIWVYKKKSWGRKEFLTKFEGIFDTYFCDGHSFNSKWDEACDYIRNFNG